MNPTETTVPVSKETPLAEKEVTLTEEKATVVEEKETPAEEKESIAPVAEVKVPVVFSITGEWETRAAKLKEKFSSLTDEDVKFETGKEAELIDRLKKRLDKGREEVVHIIKKTQEKAV
jgi:hypothetical protein